MSQWYRLNWCSHLTLIFACPPSVLFRSSAQHLNMQTALASEQHWTWLFFETSGRSRAMIGMAAWEMKKSFHLMNEIRRINRPTIFLYPLVKFRLPLLECDDIPFAFGGLYWPPTTKLHSIWYPLSVLNFHCRIVLRDLGLRFWRFFQSVQEMTRSSCDGYPYGHWEGSYTSTNWSLMAPKQGPTTHIILRRRIRIN